MDELAACRNIQREGWFLSMNSLPRPLREISPIMAGLVENQGWTSLHSSSVRGFAGDALIEKDGLCIHYRWVKSDKDFVVSLSETVYPKLDERYRYADLIEALHAIGVAAERSQEAFASAARHLPALRHYLLARGERKLPRPIQLMITFAALGLALIFARHLIP